MRRAERGDAPKPVRIASGDRSASSLIEGRT